MDNRVKFAAVATTIALTAGACGGGSTETEPLAGGLEELRFQVDELTEEVEAAEEAAFAATSTTAPVPVEKAEVEAPEPEPEVEPEPEPEVDAVVDSENPDADPAFAIDASVFAAPSGPVLDGSLTANGFNDFFRELAGPTDDIAGDLSRLDPFPAISTVADAAFVDLRYGISRSFSGSSLTSLRATLITSASPQDVIDTYSKELEAFDLGIIREGTREQGDLTIIFAAFGEYEVVAYDLDGQTIVELRYLTDFRNPRSHSWEQFETFAAQTPGLDDQLEAASADLAGSFVLQVETQTTSMTEAELRASELDRTAALGWAVNRPGTASQEFTVDSIDGGSITVSLFDRSDEEGIDVTQTVAIRFR